MGSSAPSNPSRRRALLYGRRKGPNLSAHKEELRRTLLPLGAMTKPEIREIARQIGLKVADKADSQEICFVPGDAFATSSTRSEAFLRSALMVVISPVTFATSVVRGVTAAAMASVTIF